jgi:hypothetical protein
MFYSLYSLAVQVNGVGRYIYFEGSFVVHWSYFKEHHEHNSYLFEKLYCRVLVVVIP